MKEKEKKALEKNNHQSVQPRDIGEELKDSYLDYAMSIIVSRALPDARDGLKPVHRRILWSMWDMGVTSGAKSVKSARVVGECFVKDTLILTEEGLFPIQKIKVGDRVYTQESLQKVTRLYETPSRPLLKITLENGISNITTPSQKVKVLTPDWRFEWKEVKDLNKKDYLVMKAIYPKVNNLVQLNKIEKNQPNYLNENIAYLLGLFISEGSISNDYCKKKLPRITITNTNKDIIKKIANILQQEFDYRPTIEVKNYKLISANGKVLNHKSYTIRINRKNINEFFVSNFDLENKWALTKEIPYQIFHSPKSVIFSFISGLIDGDGSIHKNRNAIHYGSISEKLINQLQILLLHQTIFANKYCDISLGSHYIGKHKVNKRYPFYCLEIKGENAIKLSLDINLADKDKNRRVLRLNRKRFVNHNRKGLNTYDIIPYAGRILFQELSNNHIGSGWYQDVNGSKFRMGIKYPTGCKIRYSLDLLEKPLRKTQIIEWKIKTKLGRIGSPLFEFLDYIIENKIYFLKVSSIRKVAPEKTYDFEVENKHEFTANGMISHNCLGKYHPHGDIAVYDALVRMAQDFSLRYPLVKGQGNFGSVDGDAPAAQRYTEVKLTPLAEEILEDLEKETVDFIPNYDGTRTEPKYLPAKIPQLILNGTMGIAVGMATNIPPHNLKEVGDALAYLVDHPRASVEDLMQFVQGPDFPTGGIIFGKQNILEAYANGKGTIVCRAKAEIVEEKGKKIIIHEIPYLVNKAELIAQIANLVEEKKIEGIKDLRDESDKEGLRIVIELKNEAIPKSILNQLFKFTALERNFHLNMLALTEDGLQPQVLSIKDILEEYVNHRKIIIRRRIEYLFKKARERAHILEGLAKALSHIDEIIKLIKSSADRGDAQKKLIAKYRFSEPQANAILEMKLQNLAKLERKKIEEELSEKNKLMKEYTLILKGPKKIIGIIKQEAKELKEKFGDERRTQIQVQLPEAIADEELIPSQETLIALSKNGYIKRINPSSLKGQKRGGKGVIAYEAKNEEDVLIHLVSCNTRDQILFFTDHGRLFTLRAFEIAEGSRASRGKTIQNYINLGPQEQVVVLLNYPSEIKNQSSSYLFMATERGIIKKSLLKEYQNIRRGGIIALKLSKNDRLIGAVLISKGGEIILTSNAGQSIRFSESDTRSMGRSASGVIGMKIPTDDKVVSLIAVKTGEQKNKQQVIVVSENGFGKRTNLGEYRKQKRGGQGIKTMKITSKTGSLVKSCLALDEEFLVAVSQKGQVIKAPLQSIPVLRRSTQGVRIMKLGKEDKIAGITLL